MKDLTDFLTPNLELKWRDKVFVVPPPSKEDGLVMTAIHVAGVNVYNSTQTPCDACGRSGNVEMDERTSARLALAGDRDLGEFSLGPAYGEMLEAGVPGPDIELFELWAFYYWVLGETVADEIIAQRAQSRSGGVPNPKGL